MQQSQNDPAQNDPAQNDPAQNDPAAHDLTPLADPVEGLSFADDLRLLADEAKALAQAEFAFQKSRAAYAGAESKTISLLLLVAAMFVFFALMALVTGTVIALGPVLGPWGAMACVTLGLLLLAGACALSARSRLKRMIALLSNDRGA
ncbi:Putative Holin-X, holin superfamily III [Novosphingobium sp. CF614]|uniref:phage holin family protein n=1 Tax=Novosphingobium sp. CF614 TaxID=1884364 RepID=UPI0008E88D86|nr:phage holin family protein [Novosphingobium sp. CF614]SFG17201.1 Putative Holin-X, holin superfamily III [Novosphingobium sp. CF614]